MLYQGNAELRIEPCAALNRTSAEHKFGLVTEGMIVKTYLISLGLIAVGLGCSSKSASLSGDAVGPGIGQELPQLTQPTPRRLATKLIPESTYELGAVIPGLPQGAIPQGLAYSKHHNAILISHYFDKSLPSCVSLIDNGSNELVSVRALKEDDDTIHFGHVGGIAVNSEYFWIASDEHVYQYSLIDLLDEDRALPLVALSKKKVETEASFCTYYDGMVFVGEFAHGRKYPTHPSHHLKDRKGTLQKAWVCGYETESGFAVPTSILSIPQKVQGIHLTEEFVFLSISYGRMNRSTISVYRNPFSDPPHRKVNLRENTAIPLWFLDGGNFVKSIGFPPMSQGLTDIDGKLAILSESGAMKYQRFGRGPVDNIILIDKNELLR